MKDFIYKLEGDTARKLLCWMWFLMFTEVEPLHFPQKLMHFKRYRHTGDKRNVSYVKRSSRFPVKSYIVTENLFNLTL